MIKPLPRYLWAIFALCILFNHNVFSKGISSDILLKKAGNNAKHRIVSKQKKYFDPAIAPAGPIVACNSTILTATGTITGDVIEWFKDGGSVASGTPTTLNVVASGSYTMTVNGGAASTAVQVTINPTPVANFTFTGNNQCMSQPVAFTDHSTGNNLAYSWDFGDPNSGNNSSTEQSPTHNFVGSFGGSNQTFNVSLTVTSAGCSNTYTTSVTAKQLSDTKLGGLSPVTYNGATYFRACGSGATQMTFVNQSTTTASNTSYRISWGDGTPDFTSTGYSSTLHNYQVGTWTLTYTITNSNGCANTATYYVFVGSNPAVGLGNPGNTAVCTGTSLRFPVTGTENNPPGTTYVVNFSDGSSIPYTTAPAYVDHVFNASSCGKTSGIYANSFSATIVATNPCSSSSASVSPIYVSDKPQAAFDITKTTACIGQNITLTNKSLGNDVSDAGCTAGNIIWTISPANGWTTTGNLGNDFGQTIPSLWTTGSNNLGVTFNTPGTYTISLKIANSICGSDIISKTICVNPTPIASFTLDNSTGCAPLVVNATNTSPATTCGTNTYQWSVSPTAGVSYTNSTNSTSTNPQFTFNNAGNYSITLTTTSPGGCFTTSPVQTITVKAKPTVSLNTPTGSICQGTSFTWNPSVTTSTTATYEWTFDGGTPSTSTIAGPVTVQYNTPGPYTTILKVTNDCGATTSIPYTITIKPTPVATVPADQSFCSGYSTGVLAFGSSVSGTTYTWNNSNTAIGLAASGNTSSINFITANVTTATTSTITVTPSINGCTGVSATFKITVSPKPTTPATTSTVSYCVGDLSSPLSATVTTGNTLNWYDSGNNLLSVAPTPSTASPGTTIYYVSQTNSTSSCESPKTQITVNVTAIPAAPGVNTPIPYCQGSAAVPLTAIASSGNTLKWYTVATGGTPLPGAPTPSTTVTGTTSYYVSQTNGSSCESARSKIDVVINPTPGLPTVSTPVSYCLNAIATPLTATPDAGNSLRWYTVSAGGTGSTSAITPTTSTVGTKTYYVSQVTSSGCESSRAPISVTINPLPVAPSISSGPVYCVGDIATPLVATSAPGNTLKWYSDAALTHSFPTAPTPSTSTAGNTTYYVTQNNGTCESAYSSVLVIVNSAIYNYNIGDDQTICTGGVPAQLRPTQTIGGGNGSYAYQWESSIDNGTTWQGFGTGLQTYSPPALSTSTQYRRTVYSGACVITSNVINITVQGTLTNYGISGNQTICSNQTPSKLIGQMPTGGNGSYTYHWESSPDGNSWTAIANTNSVDYAPGILTTTTHYRRFTSSGTCLGTSSEVIITVNPLPAVSGVANQIICNGSTTTTTNFTSSTPGTITYSWTNDNNTIGLATTGSGNISAFIPTNNTHAPNIAHFNVTATLTNGGTNCPGTATPFSITALPLVSSQPINNIIECVGTNIPAISPSSDAATFAGSTVTYSWSVNNASIGLSNGLGTTIPAFNAINTTTTNQVSTVTVTPIYHYGGIDCNGTPTSYTITIKPGASTAIAGNNEKICGTTYTLMGNTPQVGTGTWSQPPGQTAAFNDPNSPTTGVSGLVKGTRYMFKWTISTLDCSSTNSSVNIDVLSDIVNSIKTSNAAICPGASTSIVTDQLSGGDVPGTLSAQYSYSWLMSHDNINWVSVANETGETISVNPTTDTYYKRVVSSYGACPVTSTAILIKLNPVPPPATAGNTQVLCNQTSTQLNGSDPGVSFTGTWTDLNSPSALTFSPDNHTRNATVNGLQPGSTYTLKWTVTNGACGFTDASVIINDLQPLTNQIAVANPVLCYGVPVAINGVIPTGGTGTYQYSWQSSTDGTTWLTISGQNGKDLNTILTQSVKVKRIVSSGTCTLESNIVDITIQPAIDNNSITGSAVTCANQTDGTLHGSLPTGGDGNYVYQWQKSDDGITYINITGANQPDFTTPVLTTSIYYRRLVSTALCTGAQQSASNIIHVIVNPNSKADFTASALSGCAPFNLQAVITSTPYPDRNATYEWFADGVSIGSGVNFPAYSITTPNQQVLIKLVTTSSLGCDTNSHELKFRTIPTVAASFTKDQTVGCGPLTVHFVNTSVPLNAGTYAWDFGNGQTSTSIQHTDVVFQPHPLNRDTTYIITLKATTDCSINTYTDSVKVRPMPKAIFTPDQTTGCSPFTVNITNQSRGIPNTYTYYFGDGQKLVKSDNGAVQYTYTTLKTDTVTLKLVAENECGKDSSSYNIVIYPNTVNANLVVNGDNKFGCVPFTVKFDNNSTGANSFNWTFGDGNTANTHVALESLTHTFTTPGVYTVKLNATNGCSSATAMETITVYPQPVAAFSVSQLQYCAKDSVAFNNQSVADANTSYQWNFGDGSTRNAINPKHPYVNPGKYTVSLTLIKSYPNGSVCTNVVSHDVEIIPLPVATFTSNATPLNCAPFTLTVHSTPANASSVEWHFGDVGSDGNEVNGYTASHTFAKPGVYKVKLIAYNLTGCLDSTTQIVRVTETPVAAFIPGDSVLCGSSSTIHFINKSTYGGSDLVSYKWIVNNSIVSTQKDPTYTFTPPATAVFPYIYTVKLIVSSTIGCSDTVTHKIQINALPKAGFSVSVASSCAPFKAVINNTSQYADQYKWYVDNVLTSTDKVPTNIYFTQPAKTYKLKLVVNNLYGCKTDSVEKVITTYPKPKALFTVIDSTSCNGKLDLKVVNSSIGATSYNWNFGDGSAQSSAMVPTHLYGAPGLYQLRLIADNGFCKDTTTHYIQIAAPPKAGFLADNVAGCTLLTTTFQNASINATSYVWDFGDGTFSTSKNPVHTFGYLHSPYTVKLIVFGDYGCSDTTILTKYISVSAPPKAAFTVLPDTVIKIPDYSFTFKNQSSTDVVGYRWDFGDHKSSTIENPEHTYLDTGTYKVTLIVTNSDNCTDTLVRKVQVAGVPGYLYVPNAFEPGSGKRELKTFTVRASGLSEYSLKIFNKWGELIWETTKLDPDGVPLEGWDGMMHGVPAPQGVYVWKISAKYIDGTEWKGMKYPTGSSTKVGTLNLMR